MREQNHYRYNWSKLGVSGLLLLGFIACSSGADKIRDASGSSLGDVSAGGIDGTGGTDGTGDAVRNSNGRVGGTK